MVPNLISILTQSLFDQAHDAVFIIGLDGRIITANQRAADLLGYTREELTGVGYSVVIAPEQVANSQDAYQRLLAGETLPIYERIALHRDGRRIPVEVSAELIRDADGQPLYIQSHTRDIRERKQAEQQALQLALETERSRILADFIIAASHEFRTPLASINTSLHILRRVADPEARDRRIDQVQSHVDSIAELLNRMLLLTRLESEAHFSFTPIRLASLIVDAEVSQAHNFARNDVYVVHDHAESAPPCWGDANSLHAAFRELIDNAIKASPSGATVTLSTRASGGYVIAEIRDQGCGIKREHLPMVFERFFRADKSHNQRGFGLGLSIVKLIIDQHNGIVEVESEPGRGSTFRVVLPRA